LKYCVYDKFFEKELTLTPDYNKKQRNINDCNIKKLENSSHIFIYVLTLYITNGELLDHFI
jgi:hypothetical protein